MITDNRLPSALPDSITLSFVVLSERIRELPPEDRQDLFELATTYIGSLQSGNQEEADSAAAAMHEILAQESGRIAVCPPIEEPEKTVGHWVKWVSSQIRSLRTEAGLTQTQLAKLANLPQSHISRLENGEHSPSFLTLRKLADALNVPVKELDPSAPDEPCDDEQ